MFFEQGSKMMVLLVADVCSIYYFYFIGILFSAFIKEEILISHSDTMKELIMSLIFSANVFPNIVLPSYIQSFIDTHGHRKLFFLCAAASFVGQTLFLLSLYKRSYFIFLVVGRLLFGISQEQIFRIITGFLPYYFRKKHITSRNKLIILSSNLIGVTSFLIVPFSLCIVPDYSLAIIISFIINVVAFLAASLTVFYDLFLEDLSWRRRGLKPGARSSASLILEKQRSSHTFNNIYRGRTYNLSLACAVFYFSSLLSYNYYGLEHNYKYFQWLGMKSLSSTVSSQLLFINYWLTAFLSSFFAISSLEKNFNRTDTVLFLCLLLVFAQMINIIFSPIASVFIFGICYSLGYRAFYSLWDCLENMLSKSSVVLNLTQTLLPLTIACVKSFDTDNVIHCGFFALILAIIAVGLSLHLFSENQHDDGFLDIKKEEIVYKISKHKEQELFEFKECVIQNDVE